MPLSEGLGVQLSDKRADVSLGIKTHLNSRYESVESSAFHILFVWIALCLVVLKVFI